MAKLTNKDYYTIVLNVINNAAELTDDVISQLEYKDVSATDVIAWAEKNLDMIDARREKEAAKRAEKPADALTEAVFAKLTRDPQTADTILSQVIGEFPTNDEGKETSVAMIRARLNKLYKDGKIEKIDITVGEKSKKAYYIPA